MNISFIRKMIGIAVLFLILIICTVYLSFKKLSLSEQFDYNYPVLPPLNYFELQEPAYFFYDPRVHGEYATKEGERLAHLPPALGRPGMDSVTGPDNYLRTYTPDEDTSNVFNFNNDY